MRSRLYTGDVVVLVVLCHCVGRAFRGCPMGCGCDHCCAALRCAALLSLARGWRAIPSAELDVDAPELGDDDEGGVCERR